jgi:SAM-dependent methyltransferase
MSDDVLQEVISKSCPIGMRTAEYAWTLNNLVDPPAIVLDVGCITSYLSFALLKLGYDVYAIDTRWNANLYWEPWVNRETYKLWEENRTSNRVKFKLGDIRQTDYPSDFFDQVIAVSTIEHIGLSVYDNPPDDVDEGDFKAAKEIARIVKPRGNVLITVPYGILPWKQRGIQARVYDDDRLNRLTQGLIIVEQKFYGNPNGHWIEVSKERAIEINKKTPYGNEAVVCLKLRKSSP